MVNIVLAKYQHACIAIDHIHMAAILLLSHSHGGNDMERNSNMLANTNVSCVYHLANAENKQC